MSGHSKWANIKHRKGRQDALRGRIFTRIAKEITIAAREGGGDADSNSRLRLAVQNGRSNNMPADNITRAIKKGTGEIEGVNYEEFTYEGYAPNGVAAIVETVSDNKNRTVANIRALFTKMGGNLGETNSVLWNFDRKGIILVKTKGMSEDELMNHVLECGADDMEYDEEDTTIVCPMVEFANVCKYFESNGFELGESKLEYVAQNTVTIETVERARKVMRFIEVFEDNEDVQNIYTNADISDEIAEQLAND
ncbi:MAG: YebC/PmpR family DNA-binding transcriptional regulator [bacterium]